MLTASIGLLVGCGGDKTTAPTGLAGQMGFSYTGALSGTFNVTGQMPATGQETSSWAAGEIVATGTDAGTATIDFDNCSASVCSTVFFLLGLNNGTTFTFLQDCYLQSGTITITEVTSTRIRGTFSGAGTCSSSTGTQTSFTVTNGTFDVAIVPGVS